MAFASALYPRRCLASQPTGPAARGSSISVIGFSLLGSFFLAPLGAVPVGTGHPVFLALLVVNWCCVPAFCCVRQNIGALTTVDSGREFICIALFKLESRSARLAATVGISGPR